MSFPTLRIYDGPPNHQVSEAEKRENEETRRQMQTLDDFSKGKVVYDQTGIEMYENEQLIQKSKIKELSHIGHQLYDDDSSKDFKILVDGEEFKVHKCVLNVGCPHLAKFIGSISEPISAGFLSSISPKTMGEFVSFLYKREISEESSMDSEILTELIKFGLKYQMEHLVDYSISMIGAHKDNFDKNIRRKLIIMGVSLGSEKILDAILGIFKTEAFTDTPTYDYEPAKKIFKAS